MAHKRPSSSRTSYHNRFYRYVRMMLRRYPKMRHESFGLYRWREKYRKRRSQCYVTTNESAGNADRK